MAALHVVDDPAVVKLDKLGLPEQAFDQLDIPQGHDVRLAQAEPPRSMEAVRRKMLGERLTLDDYRAIAQDSANDSYSKMEMAAFLVATRPGKSWSQAGRSLR